MTTTLVKTTFPEMLEKHKAQIALALPKHLNADRMVRIAMTEFRKNEDLSKCDPVSIFAAIIMASQLGLEPGVMGQAFLIPYETKRGYVCNLIPGWQGYVDLVSRSGRASVWTNAVRATDVFKYQLGTDPKITHEPSDESDDSSPFTHAYAIGKIKGSEIPIFEVFSRKKVDAHLKQYNKVGARHYALKDENNKEMYGRKIALLQVIKYMPKSIELQTLTNLEYAAQAGAQHIDLMNDAAAGTFIFTDDGSSGSVLPSENDVPELPELKELAKQLKWNDATLTNELGRAGNDAAKLLAAMKDLAAKASAASTPARTSAQPAVEPTTASEAAVGPQPQPTPKQTTPKQRSLSDAPDF